ncbi:MAG: hypothetical protein ACE5EQ_08400 [Phycisphaerae bacterium]
MNELVTYQLPAEILGILIQRGSDVPRLKWHENPISLARRSLETIKDKYLFHPHLPRDKGMAAAVRALLYLWCGWSKECRACVVAAPKQEGLYLEALCYRQMRNLGRERRLLREMGAHPIHAALAEQVIQIPGMKMEPAFDRFLRLIEREHRWEPFLFADLFEQAVTRRLDRQGVILVRKLAAKEAELLFRHCFEAAVGEALVSLSDDGRNLSSTVPVKPTVRQEPPPAASRSVPTRTVASGSVPPLPAAVIKIICPSCRMMSALPPASRGRITCCKHCHATYHVPVRQAMGELVR